MTLGSSKDQRRCRTCAGRSKRVLNRKVAVRMMYSHAKARMKRLYHETHPRCDPTCCQKWRTVPSHHVDPHRTCQRCFARLRRPRSEIFGQSETSRHHTKSDIPYLLPRRELAAVFFQPRAPGFVRGGWGQSRREWKLEAVPSSVKGQIDTAGKWTSLIEKSCPKPLPEVDR